MITKHKYIQDPNTLLIYFDEYVKYSKSNPIKKQVFVGRDGSERWEERERPVTLLGFKNYCAKNYSNVNRYFEDREEDRESYKDYKEVTSFIRDCCLQDSIEGAMVGIYSPGITARVNNLADKVESKNTNENKIINVNVIESNIPIANREDDIKLD